MSLCSFNVIESEFKKSLTSESKVRETLLSLLNKGATIEDILEVVSKPIPNRIKRTMNPEVVSFISNTAAVKEFLETPQTINTPEALDIPSKEIEVDNPDEIVLKTKRSRTWITSAWGIATLAQDKFVKDVTRDINSKIFGVVKLVKKGENPEIQLNSAIQNYFTYNLNLLREYFLRNGKEDLAKLIEDNMPFDIGVLNPNQRINKIIAELSEYFNGMNDSDKMAYTNNKSKQHYLAIAYSQYLLINPINFDSFIKSTFPSITIRNGGKLTSDINKYSISLGRGRLNMTWLDEDAVKKITQMVDSVVQSEISSWPIYRKEGTSWIKLTDEYCDTNLIVGTLSKVINIGNLKGDSKDLLFKPIEYTRQTQYIIDDLKNTFRNAFGFNILTGEYLIDLIYDKYIEGKTIPEIINSIPQNYHQLLPIAIFLLTRGTDNINFGISSIIETSLGYGAKNQLQFTDNEINAVHSIWHNMFDPLNSASLFNQSDPNGDFDTYLMIAQVLLTHEKKNLYGIVNDKGLVGKKYYSLGKANLRLNYLQSKINGFYSPLINREIYNTTITSNFNTDEEPRVTIEFKPPYKSDKYSIIVSNQGLKIEYLKNGSKISDSEAKFALNDLKVFFGETLKLDFTSTDKLPLMLAYVNKLGNSSNKALKDLTTIVGNLIYANEVSKYLKNESLSDFKNGLSRFYKDRPELVRGVTYNQVDGFRKVFPLMTKLSLANDIHDGIIGDVVVKGGAGEQINTVNLSALLTKFASFTAEKSLEGATKDFSVREVFKEMTFLRDYVDKTGDVKSSTGMNVEEFLINNFIYDFYGDNLAIHLGVLSDKPNIPKMELNVNTPIQVEEGLFKPLKDCTALDLRKVAVRELGTYYLRLKREIDRNLSILNKYSTIAQLTKLNIYNINNDYKLTRSYKKETIEQDIHNAIYAAQLAGEDIEINELLYFSWNKGELHTKPSLIAELAKHDVPVPTLGLMVENSELFFNRKESELVANMLQDLKKGIYFKDSRTGEVIDSPAVRSMLLKNRYRGKDGNFVYNDINSWAIRDNIIIGKIVFGDSFRDLTTKKSLTNWNVYRQLHNYLKENPGYDISKLDINSSDFNFQYFILTLNELQSDIREFSHVQKLKRKVEEALRNKFANSRSKINKKALTEQYRQWRLENVRESEAELNQFVRNYESETDERQWRLRDTASKLEGFNENVRTLEDLNKINSDFKLGLDTSLEEAPIVNYELRVNPEILRYNTLHYLYSEEGLNSTVGTHINHKAKYNTNLSLLGAIETGQQAKRNVSLSGAKNQYTRGDIQGVNPTMRIAVVKDTKASISTVNGVDDPNGATPMDGSTIGNYVFRKEELYSLGSQKAGIENSKPLGNDLNPKTGTGTIIKTAEFVLTNGRIRSSERNIRLHRQMNHIPWNSNYGGNFLVDFDGNPILYHPVIVFKPSDGKYYLRNNIQIGENGLVSFDEVELDSDVLNVNVGNKLTIGSLINSNLDITLYYNTIEALGKTITPITTTRAIRSNYELWDLFGGAYSASITGTNQLTYHNDNTSLENLTIAAHSCGSRINADVKRPTNADVWLPLKEAKIDWIVTEGAIKQGVSNVNSTEMFDNINYPVTTVTISTADNGMQLNPEHLVDKSQVTLMTQVVNALGLRGFSADAANRCYQALANLTDYSLKDLFEGIEADLNGDNRQLKDAMSSLLLKAIIGTSETDGDLLAAITLQLNENDRNGHDYDIIKHKLPISDPSVLNKIISNFSSIMTKAGVRIKFPGSMNVLVPSDGIYRIHGGALRTFATTLRYENGDLIPNNEAVIEELRLQELLAQLLPKQLHEITLGGSYFINDAIVDEFTPQFIVDAITNRTSIKIDDLSTYYKVRDFLKGKQYSLIEDVVAGRELAPYNCVFNTDKGTFMLWDLDSIKHIHMATNDKAKMAEIYETYSDEAIQNEFHIDPSLLDRTNIDTFTNSFKTLINRRKQIELDSIGSGNRNDAYVNGERVIVDKSTLQVLPYELIAPKNYATTFGLHTGDRLDEIANDKFFFLKRMLDNYKLTPVHSDNYDIILKTISGKSYPILFGNGNIRIPSELKPISKQDFYDNLDWDGGKVYRLDEDGNRLYELPYHLDSNNRVVYDVEILTDALGNEVILTKNYTVKEEVDGETKDVTKNSIRHFINKINFNNIDFGRHILQMSFVQDLFREIGDSKKRLVNRFVKEYTQGTAEENNESSALVLSTNSDIIKSAINEWFNARDNELVKLQTALLAGEEVDPNNYTGIFHLMIKSAIETHTSFLKSLDYIVSRTPAQSHQSFMPMKLVGFDEAAVNSAYVSRWLLYLQGSDFRVR